MVDPKSARNVRKHLTSSRTRPLPATWFRSRALFVAHNSKIWWFFSKKSRVRSPIPSTPLVPDELNKINTLSCCEKSTRILPLPLVEMQNKELELSLGRSHYHLGTHNVGNLVDQWWEQHNHGAICTSNQATNLNGGSQRGSPPLLPSWSRCRVKAKIFRGKITSLTKRGTGRLSWRHLHIKLSQRWIYTKSTQILPLPRVQM